MSRNVVSVKLLEKIDPSFCGSEDVRRDAEHCDQKKRHDINLNDYSKVTDFFGFSDQAKFCEDFDDWYYKFNAETESCATTSPEMRQKLREIINGKSALAAQSVAIPSAAEIYADLTRDVPANKLRALQKHFEKKAKGMHDRMAEISQLQAKSSADGASLDQKVLALYKESEEVCGGADPAELKKIAADCAGIKEEHAVAKGWQDQFWGGLKVLGATIAGWIAWVFKNSKKAARGVEEIVKTKKEAEDAGKKGGFVAWLVRVLDGIGKVKDVTRDDAPNQTPTADGPASGETDPADMPAPEPGSAEDGAEVTTGDEPAAEATTPADATAPADDAAAPIDSPYKFQASFDLNKLLKNTEEDLMQIAEAGAAEFGGEHTAVKAIRAALQVSEAGGRARFFRLLALLRSPATLDLIEALAGKREREFYDSFLPAASEKMTKAAELMSRGKMETGKTLVDMLATSVPDIVEKSKQTSFILNRTWEIEKSVRAMLELPDDGAIQRIENTVGVLRSSNHDIMNITSSIRSLIGESDNAKIFVEFMRASSQFSVGDANAMMKSVAGLVRRKAADRGVTVEVVGLPHTVRIPEDKQKPLLRSLFTFVDNGVNYSDEKKVNRRVRIEARQEGSELVFTVADNGIGMTREQVDLIEKESGHRFAPKRAPGTGVGLNGAIHIAIENGFQLSFKPDPGQGMEITLRVDTSAWGKNGQASNGGTGNGGGAKSANGTATTPRAASDGDSNARAPQARSFGGVELADTGETSEPVSGEEIFAMGATDELGNPISVDPAISAPQVAAGASVFVGTPAGK